MIKNSAYKGKWVAPDIDNPEYVHDDTLYNFKDLKFVGFELWQVGLGVCGHQSAPGDAVMACDRLH